MKVKGNIYEGKIDMKENTGILRRAGFLILSILIIGDICFGAYTWLEGSSQLSVFLLPVPGLVSLLGPLGIVSLWFTLYCLSMRTSERVIINQGDHRTLIFAMPLAFLVTNIVLGVLFTIMENDDFWIGDEIPTKIIILLIVFSWIVMLLLFCKRNNIMIWCPASFYATIWSGYLGVYIVTAGIIFVFSVVEYIIMLILNRRNWNMPRSKKKD